MPTINSLFKTGSFKLITISIIIRRVMVGFIGVASLVFTNKDSDKMSLMH